jgi:hypothetical protein
LKEKQMAIIGAFCLHTNGDLVWKTAAAYRGDTKYFNSTNIRKVWQVNDTIGPDFIKDMLYEAYKMGAIKEQVLDIAHEASLRTYEILEILNQKKVSCRKSRCVD